MPTRWLYRSLSLFVATGLLLAAGGAPARAQEGNPPPPRHRLAQDLPEEALRPPAQGAINVPGKGWYLPEGAGVELAPMTAQAAGGPDDFGYTWNDGEPFNWVDATTGGGANAGLTGVIDMTNSIPLGFPFKYYTETYTEVSISAYGYLSFSENIYHTPVSDLPDPSEPNNVIAPYSLPILLGSGGSTNQVFYRRGGSAPSRWFAVEWNQVNQFPLPSDSYTDNFTFEAILYESGDIVVQYLSANVGGYAWCVSSGIEDATGFDGLSLLPGCGLSFPAATAVRIHRPAPRARVSILPRADGRFTGPGETVGFDLTIRNTGDLGADSFDLTTISGLPAAFYAEDGVTPKPNTGSLPPGETARIVARLQAPLVVGPGQTFTSLIQATSKNDSAVSKTIDLTLTASAALAQVYLDRLDEAMQLEISRPGTHTVVKAAPDYTQGYDPAVIELPNHSFLYAWDRDRCADSTCAYAYEEIQYAILGADGGLIRPAATLASHDGQALDVYDYPPALAAAPNGRVAILWMRTLSYYDEVAQQTKANLNAYFAVLDAAGNLVSGPTNVTQNAGFYPWNASNFNRTYEPTLAATGDNRFVLAWRQYHIASGTSYSDVVFSVRDTNGAQVKAPARLSTNYAYEPNLTALSGNRALAAWSVNGDIHYAVLNSAGGIVRAESAASSDGYAFLDDTPDAVQLTNGNILVAWHGKQPDDELLSIRYILLNGAYDRSMSPTAIANLPVNNQGSCCVSVTADRLGRGVLTWMDDTYNTGQYLYYALVDGGGNLQAGPVIYQSSPAGIRTSQYGYGNTSAWTADPTTNGVDAYVAAPALVGAPPGGQATIRIEVGNHGLSAAADASLTVSIDPRLTVVDVTDGAAPVAGGYRWDLGTLTALSSGKITLAVSLPGDAAIGAKYPVVWNVATASGDANGANNSATTQVMASLQTFLPTVRR